MQKQFYSFQIKYYLKSDTLEEKKQHSTFILVSEIKKVLQSTPGVYFLWKVNDDASKMVSYTNTLFLFCQSSCAFQRLFNFFISNDCLPLQLMK